MPFYYLSHFYKKLPNKYKRKTAKLVARCFWKKELLGYSEKLLNLDWRVCVCVCVCVSVMEESRQWTTPL